jgi:predicted nucleic-acid-binding Zn-ribbon protein
MARKKEVSQRFVGKYKLECPVCSHDLFWTRETLMNTAGMTMLGLDWANKKAVNYICENCGYIFWFAK